MQVIRVHALRTHNVLGEAFEKRVLTFLSAILKIWFLMTVQFLVLGLLFQNCCS